MRFITYGNKENPPVMLIHGMATTAEICYGKIAPRLAGRYYVILAVLDGHDPCTDTVFHSLGYSCRGIEKYVGDNFGGHLYALSGFSLGASITAELLQRGNIGADKVHLDAAFCVRLGALAPSDSEHLLRSSHSCLFTAYGICSRDELSRSVSPTSFSAKATTASRRCCFLM